MKIQFIFKKKFHVFSYLILALFILSACSKDDAANDDNDYMISFKVDDVLQEFTSKDILQTSFSDNSSLFRLNMVAESSNSILSLTIYDMKPIAEQPYNGYALNRSDTQISIVGSTIGYQKDELNYNTPTLSNYSKVTIEVTKKTANSVRGNFNGTLIRGDIELVITAGKFYMPIKN